MNTGFNKEFEGKTSLIIVNEPHNAGFIKYAMCVLPGADTTGILHLAIDFDAFPFPQKLDENAINILANQGPYRSNIIAVSQFERFLNVNLDSFEKITVWHGHSASEKLFLYFFAKYYGKPFNVLDFGIFGDGEKRDVMLDMLGVSVFSKLLGREKLLTDTEVQQLQRKADQVVLNDTGFHALDEKGEVVNVKPQDYTGIIYEILDENGGRLILTKLIGWMLSDYLTYSSDAFINKLVAWHLRNGLIRGRWKNDGQEILPNEEYPDYLSIDFRSPGPRDFVYRNVIIERIDA